MGYEYAKLAEDGKLTYEILHKNGEYARFLEGVEQKLAGVSPQVAQEIRGLVEESYTLSYEGMAQAVANSTNNAELAQALKGLGTTPPEAIRSIVEKGLVDETLKKHWQENIYDIKRQISIGLANGDRVETMAKRLTKSLDTTYEKAIRIARTENHRAREAGMYEGAKEIDDALKEGISGQRMVKIWRSMRDQRVRDGHSSMDGVVVLVDERFELPSGATADSPGQSGNPSDDINCRCYASYDLMNDEEFYAATKRHFPSDNK